MSQIPTKIPFARDFSNSKFKGNTATLIVLLTSNLFQSARVKETIEELKEYSRGEIRIGVRSLEVKGTGKDTINKSSQPQQTVGGRICGLTNQHMSRKWITSIK